MNPSAREKENKNKRKDQEDNRKTLEQYDTDKKQ